ncbi:MAG: penicillin-insensitive murein endopeptidase [Myxococcales bacterium]|nr:penicillin-insensitive murein endopeptidase [Myxococcales bacterium]
MRSLHSLKFGVLPGLLVSWLLWAVPGQAMPPTSSVDAAMLERARWIKHRVVPGERVEEIAERYAVATRQLLKWNRLDEKRPRLRAGQRLRVFTRLDVPPAERIKVRAEKGDSWALLAKRHDVDAFRLQKYWNRGHGRLRAGDEVVVWVQPKPPTSEEVTPVLGAEIRDGASAATPLPVVEVPSTAHSVGSCSRGRLRGGIQLPRNDALYIVRDPAQSYGSSHTIDLLQRGIAKFRAVSGFDRQIVIGDISRRRGGRFRPHRSHRSGRDVDIRLPLARGVPEGTVPTRIDDVDWDASWALIKALLDTGKVQFIFLSRSRQRPLQRAAKRAGMGDEELAPLLEYPSRGGRAVIRHAGGHTKHFHVRFACAGYETLCRDM